MIRSLLQKNYMLYGGSIIATRALEYVVLFFAASYLAKEEYGELEYYKKVIEVGATVFAFGFPALIISYTKSEESKQYFFLLGSLFVLVLAIIVGPILGLFNWGFLVIPFVFYALFFNGGIAPAFLLVRKGSDYAAYYKIVVSVLFYAVILVSIVYFDVSSMAYVTVNYVLFPITLLYITFLVWKERLLLQKIKRYWRLFKKLLLSSFTLVVSNFANLMFLYTDIFILKMLSNKADLEIADFSFALNIANLLLFIPLTLVQVDIEKLKKSKEYLKTLNKKIVVLVLILALMLVGGYQLLIQAYFPQFEETFFLFLFILGAKIFHAFSSLYGTYLLILKKFKANLIINCIMLLVNVGLCYIFYSLFGILGIAGASAFSLMLRYFILVKMNTKYTQ